MSIGPEELAPAAGSTHYKKRIGRGHGSGQGTYAGKGLKGQKSRSGKKLPYDSFEGGQFPSSRKFHVLRGFSNARFKVVYQPINLAVLDRFDADAVITPESLKAAGLLSHLRDPIKILGDGALTKALNVHANKFSESARAAIAAAGGNAILIGPAGE